MTMTCEFCKKDFEDGDIVEYEGIPEYGLGGGKYCHGCYDLMKDDFEAQVKAVEILAKSMEKALAEKISEGT